MKKILVLALALTSMSTFASQSLLLTNKSGEKIGQMNCDGSRADETITMVSDLMKNKTVKDVVSTRESIKINLDENKDSDGSSTDSITFERLELDQYGTKCQLAVEI